MTVFLLILFGYLSGNILYAYILPKIFRHSDVTENSDDHNPGVFNAFKYGITIGILTLICELMKGTIPVFVGLSILPIYDPWIIMILLSPVIGHAFPIFHHFIGGKGIAVSFGVMIGLALKGTYLPLFLLCAIYILFSTVIIIETHFYRSVITFDLFVLLNFITMGFTPVTIGCLFISMLVIFKHYQKTETRKFSISFLKKS